jgi:hypothetical protein
VLCVVTPSTKERAAVWVYPQLLDESGHGSRPAILEAPLLEVLEAILGLAVSGGAISGGALLEPNLLCN